MTQISLVRAADVDLTLMQGDGFTWPVTYLQPASVYATNVPPAVPLTVVAATNDTFLLGGTLYAVRAGTYGTVADIATAMATAINGLDAHPDDDPDDLLVIAADDTGKIRLTSLVPGLVGTALAAGPHDVLAGLGFTAGQTITQTPVNNTGYTATLTVRVSPTTLPMLTLSTPGDIAVGGANGVFTITCTSLKAAGLVRSGLYDLFVTPPGGPGFHLLRGKATVDLAIAP